MILQIDEDRHLFSVPNSISPIATDVKVLLNEAIGEEHEYETCHLQEFNDLSFYLNLLNREGCIKVELSAVKIRHSNDNKECTKICSSIQATYKSTFASGTTLLTVAPLHKFGAFFPHPMYPSDGYVQDSDFILEDGEYLVKMHTSNINSFFESSLVKCITLITNQRTASFGGIDKTADTLPSPDHSRIIAFVGTSYKLGTISICLKWETIGHLICLRALVEQDRATPLQCNEEGDETVERFIMSTSRDLFRRIVLFL